MFCKNDNVKQKKQVLSVKQTESYAQADIIALTNLKVDMTIGRRNKEIDNGLFESTNSGACGL